MTSQSEVASITVFSDSKLLIDLINRMIEPYMKVITFPRGHVALENLFLIHPLSLCVSRLK